MKEKIFADTKGYGYPLSYVIGYKEFAPYFTAVEEAIKNDQPTGKTRLISNVKNK
jgi:hypothetical protein